MALRNVFKIHYWQQTGTKTLVDKVCGKCEAKHRDKFNVNHME